MSDTKERKPVPFHRTIITTVMTLSSLLATVELALENEHVWALIAAAAFAANGYFVYSDVRTWR